MSKIQIYLCNLGKYTEGILWGTWVKLPVSEESLEKVLKEIGINEMYEEYFITDSESEIVGISDVINEFSNIQKLNELAECLELLSSDDISVDKSSESAYSSIASSSNTSSSSSSL